MHVERELLQLLMEIGFLASGYGFHQEADTIFKGVRAARPESELPWIGLAVAKMNQGRYDEAVRLLRDRALGINPESDLVKSFLGLGLKLGGSPGRSREVLMAIRPDSDDPVAFNMARALLSEQE